MSTSTGTAALPAVSSMHWVWDAMEPVERSARMRELGRWTAWLVSTFHLGNKLNGCWYQPRDVVEVLTGLYLHWVQAYTLRSRRPAGEPRGEDPLGRHLLLARIAPCHTEVRAGARGRDGRGVGLLGDRDGDRAHRTASRAAPRRAPALHEMLQRQRQLLGA